MRGTMFVVLAAGVGASACMGQVVHSFTPLGELPGGTFSSRASGIAADGTAVVGRSNNGVEVAVVWTKGPGGWSGPVALGQLVPGGSAEARACTSGGAIIYGDANDMNSFRHPVMWELTPAPAGPTPLAYAAAGYSGTVYACSADGSVACGEYLEGQVGVPPPLPITRAFRWANGEMVSLGTIPGVVAGPGHVTVARACSDDGSVIVGNAHDATFANRPWRWTQAGGMVDISGGQWPGIARGVSPDGGTVVGTVTEFGVSQPFLWTEAGGRVDLSIGDQVSGGALDVSSGGRRACGLLQFGAGNNTAVIWDSEGLRSVRSALLSGGVEMSLWNLQNATAISSDGTVIAGFGVNPSGQTEAWVATIPMPCPADFDGNRSVQVPDIFAFLSAWFAGLPEADFDGQNGIGVPDIFAFLSAWFAGC